MTPLEKARAEKGRINYCDECEHFEIVDDGAYCKASGKLIHPIMLVRRQGAGPAWNCKRRMKPVTNIEKIRAMTDKELADWLSIYCCRNKTYDAHCETFGSCEACWLAWLNEEVTE